MAASRGPTLEKLKVTVNADDVLDSGIDIDLDFEPVENVDFFTSTTETASSAKDSDTVAATVDDAAASDDDVTFRVTMDESKTERSLFGRRTAPEKPAILDMTTDDVTRPETQQRRIARAKRFGIEHETKDFTVSDEDLAALYQSMEVNPKSEFQRLEAIYMRGVDDMSTFDVQRIFAEYYPERVEWVNDSNCNVIWPDAVRAARALLDLTKPLKRVRPPKADPEEGEVDHSSDEEEGQLKQADGDLVEVRPELGAADDGGTSERKLSDAAERKDDCVEVDISKIAVPPGKWRVLTKHVGDNTFLIARFSTTDDVKNKNAHRQSKYYLEHGNPHFGGVKGLVSGTVRRMMAKKRRRDGAADGDGEEYSYKWVDRTKVRPGLNVFNDSGDELEWDYEHDTRFYEKTEENAANTAAEQTDASSRRKSRGRGTKKFKPLGGGTMRADDEETSAQSGSGRRRRRNPGQSHFNFERLGGGGMNKPPWSDDSDDDDDLEDFSDDRHPSPTPQPWDAPIDAHKMKVTVENEAAVQQRLGRRKRAADSDDGDVSDD